MLPPLTGTSRIIATLLYGSGLRLSEALRLRIKDVDIDAATLLIRCSRGPRTRFAMVPPNPATTRACRQARPAQRRWNGSHKGVRGMLRSAGGRSTGASALLTNGLEQQLQHAVGKPPHHTSPYPKAGQW